MGRRITKKAQKHTKKTRFCFGMEKCGITDMEAKYGKSIPFMGIRKGDVLMKKGIAVLLSLALLTTGTQIPKGNAVSEAKTDEIKKEISFALEKNQEKNQDRKSYIISMTNDIG